jgi:dTDP-4-amino-4,6-dideoxygalactose transaminase
MGVGPGDEVITQANTYVATSFAVNYCGATPVFVDIDPVYSNLDISKVEARITPRTRVIIPVHIYGHPVDMDPLIKLAERYNLQVLEDASHAHGATYKGRQVGSLGHAAAFSFYPSKVLGAYGDAGCIVTDDEDLDHRIRVLRYMGQEVKHTHRVIGFQQRLDPIQAAVLRVKLRHLDGWVENRRRIARRYGELLKGLPVAIPCEADWARQVFYLYTIRCTKRDALADFLAQNGIETQKIYHTPVPMQPCYRELDYKESDIPTASKYARQVLNLPIFPEMTELEVGLVGATVRKFFEEK